MGFYRMSLVNYVAALYLKQNTANRVLDIRNGHV
jgi:hypothetical protein